MSITPKNNDDITAPGSVTSEAGGEPAAPASIPSESGGAPVAPGSVPSQPEQEPSAPNNLTPESEGAVATPASVPSQPEQEPSAPNNLTPESEGAVATPASVPSQPEQEPSAPNNLTPESEGAVATPASVPSQPEQEPSAPNNLTPESEGAVATPASVPSQPEQEPNAPNAIPPEQPTGVQPPSVSSLALLFPIESYAQGRNVQPLLNIMDFERASTSTFLNRRQNNLGQFESFVDTVGIDEPAIDAGGGMAVYDAVTNEVLHSEEIDSNLIWQKVGDLSVISSNETAPDGTLTASKVSSSGGITNRLQQNISIADSGQISTGSAFVKRGNTDILSIQTSFVGGTSVTNEFRFDFATEEMTDFEGGGAGFSVIKLGQGFYKLSWSIAGNGTNTDASYRVYPSSVLAGQEFIIWGAQLTQTSFPAPYIKTTDAPATRAADIASVPMAGNMPPAGQPFTIVCDCAFLQETGKKFTALRTVQSSLEGFALLQDASDIRFILSNGSSNVLTGYTYDSDEHRFICRYESGVQSLFVDGQLAESKTNNTPTYNFNKPLYIGVNGNGNNEFLNSEIRNFKIYQRALTDEEILALGGPA